MAITNAMIIDIQKQQLAEAGILKYTGRMLEGVDMAGNAITFPEVEDIHTFQGWKALGYKVKKGEHARARFSIWKHSGDKIEDEDGEEKKGRGYCFMKEACWFTKEQVEFVGLQ